MRQGVFRRIFVLYAVVAAVTGLVTEFYITSAVRSNYVARLQGQLVGTADLVADRVSFRERNLDALCRETKNAIGARVTVIRMDGHVIGDSDHPSAEMDNHANRAEVQQAEMFGTGMAIRRSDTLNVDLLYVTRKVRSDEQGEGILRLAVPLTEVNRAVNLLRMKILLVVLAVLLATWVVAVWQTEHLRRLLKQITGFSQSLSRGEIDRRLFLENAGEFSEIADNLSSMSETLQGVMARSEEERSRLNVILRSVPDALLIIDERGRVTLSNASAQEYFGTAEPGVMVADVVRNHAFTDLIGEVRQTLRPGMAELAVEYPVGKHLAVRVSPLSYREGELSGFVAVFHDITEIRKLEQVRKDFVANVSHELKTPITAITGFADTLLDGALADKENAERFVQTIKSNSERINALVDDLMMISKIELGVITVVKAPVDVREVLEEIEELFRVRAAEKGLTLKTSIAGGIDWIDADRNRLIQIMTNLVDNAIKFTETGGVTLGADRTAGRTFLFVADTGIGVPAKYLPRLGERFFRVDPARSRKMGGTGLGLAIVKHLVRAHGWSMQIESVYGQGSTTRIFVS